MFMFERIIKQCIHQHQLSTFVVFLHFQYLSIIIFVFFLQRTQHLSLLYAYSRHFHEVIASLSCSPAHNGNTRVSTT